MNSYSLNPEFSEQLHKAAADPNKSFASRLAAGQEVRVTPPDHTMAPTIWPHDQLVFGFPDLSAIQPGDIIVYRQSHKLVVRRVVHRLNLAYEDVFITRCDAGERKESRVSALEVMGVLKHVERGRERIPASRLRPGIVARVVERIGEVIRGWGIAS